MINARREFLLKQYECGRSKVCPENYFDDGVNGKRQNLFQIFKLYLCRKGKNIFHYEPTQANKSLFVGPINACLTKRELPVIIPTIVMIFIEHKILQ